MRTLRKLREPAGITLLAASAVALGACAAEAPIEPVVPPPAVAVEPPEIVEFARATSAFREYVRLLEVIPPAEEHSALRRSIVLLADAVEDVPYAQEVAAVGAARVMREHVGLLFGSVVLDDEPPVVEVKRALQTAAGALRLAAEGPYRTVPEVKQELGELERAIDAIDVQGTLRGEREDVLRALRQAGEVLETVRAAAGPLRAQPR